MAEDNNPDSLLSEPADIQMREHERTGSVSLGAIPNSDGMSPTNGNSSPPAQLDPAVKVVRDVIGVSTLLNRLKQSIASAKEFALFLKKRSTLEEEHSNGLKKLCRITTESIRRPEHRHGSFLQSYEEVTMIHERMADNGGQFAVSLHQMHEDLLEMASNIERSRKHWKTNGLAAEQRVADTEAAMKKSKAKYDALAEDYDRARTGDRQTGKLFGLKGPKSAAQHEEDLLRKVQAADADYSSKVQTAQSQRAELWSKLRPEAVQALEDLIKECDSALTLQMQKFASFNEKLLLSNGLNVSPIKGAEQGSHPRSLREVVYAIDNEKDLNSYITSFAAKVPPRASEIVYERNAVLNPTPHAAPQPQRQSDSPTSFPPRQGQVQQHPHQSHTSQPLNQGPTPGVQRHERSFSQGPPMQHQYNPGSVSPQTGISVPGPTYNSTSLSSSGPPQLSSLPFQTSQTPPPSFPQQPSNASSYSQHPSIAQTNNLPPLKPVFGLSLEQLFERDGSAVPMVLYQCIQAVDLFGLEVEGIYRLSGTASHIAKIKAMFDNDASKVDFRNPENFFHDVNSVAGLLKQFLRDLPDPLLTSEQYAGFIEAAKHEDDIVRRDSLHAIINNLPDPNYATLRALTLHLNRVTESSASNRMNASNLAIVFGPTLMGQNPGPNIQDAGWQLFPYDGGAAAGASVPVPVLEIAGGGMNIGRLGQRPPQRSLSGTNIIQRPPPLNRASSQQFPSPTKKNSEGLLDLDGLDTALGRYGTTPKNGGSRLKLEISKDSRESALLVAEAPRQTPDGTHTSWQPSPLPPRGRPQPHFDVPSISTSSPGSGAIPGGGNHLAIPLRTIPLPPRPGQHTRPAPEKPTRVIAGNSLRKDGRPKPYILEIPRVAPHYSLDDFSPWTGNHPEDQFSETVIRQGFFDKTQMTQNETGSARSTVSPALKNKSRLQSLSSLFTTVLSQRRSHGQITSASTFKPPPRVTVTDTKREIWLRDLANPAISLRRLSRSIPHGIRGRVLLDQALSKNIQIRRAVWLAKCVGANELRAFRRKGPSGVLPMGGEAKWIRDFTISVEQFVESVVGSCGEKDFRDSINYTIRLATRFYSEFLLDREHYMDWLVSSLENSPQVKLPVWLLITQIYWKDLSRFRKYGRRLSSALLSHFSEALNDQDQDILSPMTDRLRFLLRELMASSPESFVSIKLWAKHKHLVLSSLAHEDESFTVIFTAIDERNKRLNSPIIEKEFSSRQHLISLLDSFISPRPTRDLVEQCWQLDDNKIMLSHTVLQWSTSAHRPGTAKIYVAARIMRSWSRLGIDITEIVLGFLDSNIDQSYCDCRAFYHLVSELSRSEHFSIPVYLQWLIARGGLHDSTELLWDGPCATRLLAELPIHNLSDNMLDLRKNLLHRAAFSVETEELRMNTCMILMNKHLPDTKASLNPDVDLHGPPTTVDLADCVLDLSRTSRSGIGFWLRQKVRAQVLQPPFPPLDGWAVSPMRRCASAITAAEFSIIREYLELIDDYSVLADVLKFVASSNDTDVLAACADTLELHLETFAAIGALEDLFEILLARLRSLAEDTDAISRAVLVSLSSLASRIPGQNDIAQQLSYELTRSDRKTAADACSPVSDHMAGIIQSPEADFTDEIERVLASGTSMDQATLERLFRRITLRLEAFWNKSTEQQRECGLLLARLRTFDVLHFDTLMVTWVNQFLERGNRPSMVQVLAPLVSFGCVELRAVLANSCSVAKGRPADRSSLYLLQAGLALLIAPLKLPELMTADEAYRLRIKQAHMQADHITETLAAIRQGIEASVQLNGDPVVSQTPRATDLINGSTMRQLLRRLVLIDANRVGQTLVLPLLRSSNPNVVAAIETIVDRLLITETAASRFADISPGVVLDLAGDLTLPFCQLKLLSMFANEETSCRVDGAFSGRFQSLDNAIKSAVTAGNTAWTCIVPLLDITVAQHLCEEAQTQFLKQFPSPGFENTSNTEDILDQVAHARDLLYIIEVTAYSITSSPSTGPLAVDVVTTLNNTWRSIPSVKSSSKEPFVFEWLPLLLSFVTIYTAALDATKIGHEFRVQAIIALTAILLELQALDSHSDGVLDLTEKTFDLVLQLVDCLPDDFRQQCIRRLHDAGSICSSPELRYMLSIPTNPSDWLYVTLPEKGNTGSSNEPITGKERLTPFALRRWEILAEPTPYIGANDTSMDIILFGARKN
ncbi:hypothetical protein B7494_g3506 [Chlorociboria aeruginascens]|nr:hypothetical protein B7494_g3506 [Chlorociboria aeruginascens]